MGEGIQGSLGLGIWGIFSEAFRLFKGSLQSLWSGDKHLCRVLDQETAVLKKIPPPQNQIFFSRIITMIQVRVWLQIPAEKGEARLSKYGTKETPSSNKATYK